MISVVLLGEHIVAGSLSRDDELSPGCDHLRNLVIIDMVEAVLVAFESAIVLEEVVAHHVCAAMSSGGTETH